MHDEQHDNQVIDQLQEALYGFVNPAMALHDHIRIIFEELFKCIDGKNGTAQLVTSEARSCYFGYTPEEGIVSWEPNETIACPPFIHHTINGFSLKRFEHDSFYVIEQSKTVYAQLLRDNKHEGYLAIQVAIPDERTVSIITGYAAHIVKCVHQHTMFDDLMFYEKMALLEKVFTTLIHDIKNPLSGISGFVQLIGQKTDDTTIRKYCGIILDSLTQLSDIVTEFKAIISGKKSPLEAHRLLVSELIHDLVESVRETYLHNGITLVPLCEEGLAISGNKERLSTVFKHILKNAKEAMPDGGTVTIQTKKENAKVILSVSDTGTGIPALKQDIVFKPFVSYAKEHAAGLGMAMARKIIQEHGGTISVTSFLGKGTVFTIQLPLFTKEAVP